jgi:hypothetical protein
MNYYDTLDDINYNNIDDLNNTYLELVICHKSKYYNINSSYKRYINIKMKIIENYIKIYNKKNNLWQIKQSKL